MPSGVAGSWPQECGHQKITSPSAWALWCEAKKIKLFLVSRWGKLNKEFGTEIFAVSTWLNSRRNNIRPYFQQRVSFKNPRFRTALKISFSCWAVSLEINTIIPEAYVPLLADLDSDYLDVITKLGILRVTGQAKLAREEMVIFLLAF